MIEPVKRPHEHFAAGLLGAEFDDRFCPMARFNWPDDHPNTKNLLFVESSRQVIARVPPSPLAESTSKILDQIEHLIVDKSREQIFALVGQVGPLMNEAVARMEILRPQIKR